MQHMGYSKITILLHMWLPNTNPLQKVLSLSTLSIFLFPKYRTIKNKYALVLLREEIHNSKKKKNKTREFKWFSQWLFTVKTGMEFL